MLQNEMENILKRVRRVINRVIHQIAKSCPGSTSLRPRLHKLRGVSIGSRVFIGEDVIIESEYPDRVIIGNNVQIALRTVIMAHINGPGRVVIEDDCYVGAGCIITCGPNQVLRIGQGAVIGAGSVITSSVSEKTFVRNSRPKVVARVGKPLPQCKSYEEFLSNLSLPK